MGLHELQELGITTSTLDVSSSQQVKSFIEQAHDVTGRLDVLFNNAGMGFGYKVHDMPEGAFEHHVVFIYLEQFMGCATHFQL